MIKEGDFEMLLADINTTYGYDLSDYSKASLKRRIKRVIDKEGLPSMAELRYKIINEEDFMNFFLEEITVNVTEMFRDPETYKMIRKKIIPQLATYPIIRIWCAGCSTGEEVYSLAILLEEEGLLDRSIIYATDINQSVLATAKEGIFPISKMKDFSRNYIEANGKSEFSNYYVAHYDKVKFKDYLRNKMVFAVHNLVTDHTFNVFDMIMCRNVMIYFNRDLQSRVLQLFTESLVDFGFLALGTKESIRFLEGEEKYKLIQKSQKLWRKKGEHEL